MCLTNSSHVFSSSWRLHASMFLNILLHFLHLKQCLICFKSLIYIKWLLHLIKFNVSSLNSLDILSFGFNILHVMELFRQELRLRANANSSEDALQWFCSEKKSNYGFLSALTSGGRPMQNSCTPCRLCRLFKTFKTTENKSLEFRSREVGDGLIPIKLTGIRKEPVQLGEKGGFLNVWKKCACTKKNSALGVHAPKKSVHKVCMHFESKYLPNVFINRTSLDRCVRHWHCVKILSA